MKKHTIKNPNGIGSIEPRGKKGIYVARWMVDGIINKRSTKTADKNEAMRILQEWTAPFLLKSDAETAQALAAQAKVKANLAKAIPLDQMFDEWKASPRKQVWSEGTERNNRYRVMEFLKWIKEKYPAAKSMADITSEIAEEYIATVIAPKSGPARYNDTIVLFSTCWNVLQGKGNGAINPWIDIKRQRAHESGRKPFTAEEEKMIIDNAKSEEWRTLFYLAIYTGQRLGDCCNFKWEDINFAENIFNPFRQMKTGKMINRLPLHPALRAQLEKTPEDQRTGLIMPGMNHRYHHGSIDNCFRTYLRKLGIIESKVCAKSNKTVSLKTFHSFRHTVISNAANRGVTLDITSRVSGHLSKETAERYFHEDDAAKRSVIFAQPDFSTDAQTVEHIRKIKIDNLTKMVEGWTADEIKEAIKALQAKIA